MPRKPTQSAGHAETEETRRAILRAAHQLFMEQGYRAVTTRMVAESSGIRQPAIYYHFADKETLYLEVLREQSATTRAALERIAARSDDSIPERLRAAAQYLRRIQQVNMGVFLHELQHDLSPAGRTVTQELFRNCIMAPLMSIFEEGIHSGFLRAPESGGIPPRVAAFLFLNIVSHLAGDSSAPQNHPRSDSLLSWGTDNDPVDALIHALIYGLVAEQPGQETP
jgi:AcrR family transcriptional regulator